MKIKYVLLKILEIFFYFIFAFFILGIFAFVPFGEQNLNIPAIITFALIAIIFFFLARKVHSSGKKLKKQCLPVSENKTLSDKQNLEYNDLKKVEDGKDESINFKEKNRKINKILIPSVIILWALFITVCSLVTHNEKKESITNSATTTVSEVVNMEERSNLDKNRSLIETGDKGYSETDNFKITDEINNSNLEKFNESQQSDLDSGNDNAYSKQKSSASQQTENSLEKTSPFARPDVENQEIIDKSTSKEKMKVYVGSNGKKYHYQHCRSLKKSSFITSYTIEDAKKHGYSPCGICNPPSSD